jgi:hypothetical protein
MGSLVISPEPFIHKYKSLARAKSLYLDVMDGRVRLAWNGSSDDGSIDFMERADAIGLGISYDMFLDPGSIGSTADDTPTLAFLGISSDYYGLILQF